MPDSGDIHVNALASEISIAIVNDPNAFVAKRVFPIVTRKHRSDRYAVYADDAFMRSMAKERMRGQEAPGGDFDVDTTATYFCREYVYRWDLHWIDRDNEDDVFNLEQDGIDHVTSALMLAAESQFAASFFQSGIWSNELSGSTTSSSTTFIKWTLGGSDPVADIGAAMTQIKGATGLLPNGLLISRNVRRVLKNHANIRDYYKYTRGGPLTDQILAEIFEVEEVVVADAAMATSAPGVTPTVNSYVFGDNALLYYKPKRPGIKTPSAGYIFVWERPTSAGDLTVAIRTYPIEHLSLTRIEGSMNFDMKIVSPKLGFFFNQAI